MTYPKYLEDYRELHRVAKHMIIKNKIGDNLLSVKCITLCAIIFGVSIVWYFHCAIGGLNAIPF